MFHIRRYSFLLPYSLPKARHQVYSTHKGNYTPCLEKSLRVCEHVFNITICLSLVTYNASPVRYNFSIHTNPFLAYFVLQFICVSHLFVCLFRSPNVSFRPILVSQHFVFMHVYSERLQFSVFTYGFLTEDPRVFVGHHLRLISVTRSFFTSFFLMGKNYLDSYVFDYGI